VGAVIQGDFGRSPDLLLTKRRFATKRGRSTRWLEKRVAEGLPSEVDDRGHRMFRPSEADPWLDRYEREGRERKPKPTGLTKSDSDRLDELGHRVKELERQIAKLARDDEADEPPPSDAA
jgi:hypothetical protein